MHTRTKNICKLCRDKRVTHNKLVYSYSIIRFDFSPIRFSSIYFLPIRFSSIYFLPIRFSTFFSAHSIFDLLFCPFDFQIFKKVFGKKVQKILKMTMSCTPTRTKNNFSMHQGDGNFFGQHVFF
jgi:hypothetical protein